MDGNERLFDALVDALHRSREGDLDRPLTVAEIYQDLVPYRIARAELGFAMNADYEHALMRLLAGEGERLRLEPVEARDDLRRELASRNPDVTLYRKYAACDVWVSDSAAGSRRARPEAAEVPGQGGGAAEGERSDGSGAAAASSRERSASPAAPNVGAAAANAAAGAARGAGAGSASSGGASTLPAPRKRAAAEGTASAPSGASAAMSAGSVACASCGSGLPADRPIRFCPWCGADRRPSCRACGEVLEPDWRFCTRCGSPAAGT